MPSNSDPPGTGEQRARLFFERDADLSALSGRTVGVLGFGNQGAAQAANLRDHGVDVVVGNREDEYAERAREHGFAVLSLADAAARSSVVLLLVPDEVQPEVFAASVQPGLGDGDTLVVASGYNLTFGLVEPPPGVDVVMVAPRMIGEAVRARHLEGGGSPSLVSVERDVSGSAFATMLAVARGAGVCQPAIASLAREEAALDLFSEQAVWPVLLSAFREAYRVLHGVGFSDEAILSELYLSGEPAEVLSRSAAFGLFGQLRLHSHTSQFGQLRAYLADDGAELHRRFAEGLHDQILSGRFAAEWSNAGADALGGLLRQAGGDPLARADEQVRARLLEGSGA
jgi:ketol-acid reductoisomerase